MKRDTFSMTKAVRNEQLVRELDRKRHRELFMVVMTALVLTVAVIVYAWPHFEIIRLGYRMEELRERREVLVEEKRHLELQLATESDPERIERIAIEVLGMVYPGPDQVLVLEPFAVMRTNDSDSDSDSARDRGVREDPPPAPGEPSEESP